ncbi:MAG: NFACT family protein, partial [Candidatus Eremiobacteraeota bacterium]|nr:NFACT family protein [Candidatus Eremiobacteraeota bacterium]
MIFVGVGCVFTDWILIARLARELHKKVARARVTALGHLDDRRIALEYWREGKSGLVAFDLFGRLPVATLEGGELAISSERGFIRAAGAVLRGLTLAQIDALPHERVLRFEFATRSRFGVAASSVLIAELIPRFGNLILLKDETIVAAYKEFNLRSGSRRAIRPGVRYEPPPAIAQPSKSRAPLSTALENKAEASEIARALREVRPRLPQLLAASVVAEITEKCGAHTVATEDVLGRADALLKNAEGAIEAGKLLAYYDRGVLVQAHLVPLRQFAGLECSAQPELLPILYQARTSSSEATGGNEFTKERRDLSKKLQHQLSRTSAEIDAVDE